MSVVKGILATYRNPKRVMAQLLQDGAREDRALAYLMIGCFVMFIARFPVLSRQAHLSGEEFSSLAGGAFVGGVFLAPLVFYGIAAISHMVAQAMGGAGSWLTARVALFWSVLVISPLTLLKGLIDGFIGKGPALTLVTIIIGIVFVTIWIKSLRVAEGYTASVLQSTAE